MKSSCEEDISDEEMSRCLKITILRRKRTIRVRPNHFNVFGDADFYARFRMSKTSAYSILELIASHIKTTKTIKYSLSEELIFLITLRVYGTGGMLWTIGDVYGVSTTTVSNVVAVVTFYIARLGKQFITFPNKPEEIAKLKEEFYDIAKFPQVIAALDCAHVRIISPGGEDAELYRDRKGFFSVNVQTMCDSKLKILDIVARWPGSAHHSNILSNSRIYTRFDNGEFGDSVIVADSGYPNKSFIMTPLLNVASPEENLYRRFPILSLGVRLNFHKVEAIIVATAVLHNICCTNNERDVPTLPERLGTAVTLVNGVPNNLNMGHSNGNNQARRQLINSYFKNLL